MTGRTPSTAGKHCLAATLVVVGAFAGLLRPAAALDVTGYSATVNDRFTGGFPTNPTPNTDPSFVGAGYDWSGVGWSTTIYAASSYKGLALLSPRHFLTAQHYENGGLLTQGVRIRTNTGTVVSETNSGIDNLGYGLILTNVGVTAPDLAMGTLAAPIAASSEVARYAVLDLFPTSSSTTYSVYNNLPLLAYGRGATTNGSPRTAATSVNLAAAFNSNAVETAIRTLYTGSGSVQLVEGDSASPLLNGWTNPNGGAELTLLGVNSATDLTTYNYMSLLAAPGAMNAANAVMTPDGYALRVQGNSSATWVGGSGGPSTQDDLSRTGNWSSGSIPTDLYVLFNGTSSAVRAIDVNGATNLRGLSFKATGTSSDGFTFSGANGLTIGRGGLTNYDSDRQTFSASLVLGDHQYWDVGSGGVTAAAINTNGKLLEVAGSGTARITGAVSGTGGLALSGHRLELTGSSSYSGGTWVHSGALVVTGTIASSSGVSLDAGATLGGSGRVGTISGAGAVGPGNSPGILTATSVNPSGGLDFDFEFTQTGAPTWASGTASGNDVLRLTDPTTPFTTTLGASSEIDVFLGVTSLSLNDTFQGGFFTDKSGSFLSSIQSGSYTYYVLGNGAGTAKTYNGQGYYLLDTTFWPSFESVLVSTVSVASATFAGGTVTNGQVMQFVMVPEPATLSLVAVGVVLVAVARRRK